MATFDPESYAAESAPFDPAAYVNADEAIRKSTATAKKKAELDAVGKSGKQEIIASSAEKPTLDATNTGAFHTARHLAFGLGDKIIAAEQAFNDWRHDKTGKVTLGDIFGGPAYQRNLRFNDQLVEDSDAAHPVAPWVGNVIGVAGSLAATVAAAPARAALAARGLVPAAASALGKLTLSQLAGQGAKIGAALGAVGGYGADRSESTAGTLTNSVFGGAVGAGLGAAVPYGAAALGRGAQALGGKFQNVAGWLKVHSLHPTPTLAEAMSDLPGGEAGVGKELLERGIGGLTKKSTAAQIEAAKEVAGGEITDIAKRYDTLGGQKISPSKAIFEGWDAALKLQKEPTTEAAGTRLRELMTKYESKFFEEGSGYKPTSATELLTLKRAVAKAAYGASEQLKRTGDVVAGDLGAGLSKFERAIDDLLDQSLGPQFEQANLAYRRLLGAGQAAERSAARTQGGSHLVAGIVPTLVGGGAAAAGHSGPEAIGAALGSALLQKYGSQAGARLLYSPVVGGLNLADVALGRLAGGLPGLAGVAGEQASPYGTSLVGSIGPYPAMAQSHSR